MKNNEFIFNIIDDLPDELIEKARPRQYSEKTNHKKSLFLWLVPSFAACAALIITVNIFTDMKNPKSPGTEISVVSEVTTTTFSDTETTNPETVYTSKSESEKIYTTSSSAATSKTVTTAESSEITSSKYLPVVTSVSEISSVSDTSVITVSAPLQETPSVSVTPVTTVALTLPETSFSPVTTDLVATVTSVVSESVTTEDFTEDLFTEVLNSFGKNAIVLDYTRNDYNRKVCVITEDGKYQYFSDGKLATIKMKNGKSLPVNEINEKINSKMIFLMENSTDEYEIIAQNKEKLEYIYSFLNYDDIETIDEYYYVDELSAVIESILLKTTLSKSQIIKKYSALNLYEKEEEYDTEKWNYYFGCIPDRTNDFYMAISDMMNENVDFHFEISILENGMLDHYASKKKNVYTNKSILN